MVAEGEETARTRLYQPKREVECHATPAMPPTYCPPPASSSEQPQCVGNSVLPVVLSYTSAYIATLFRSIMILWTTRLKVVTMCTQQIINTFGRVRCWLVSATELYPDNHIFAGKNSSLPQQPFDNFINVLQICMDVLQIYISVNSTLDAFGSS